MNFVEILFLGLAAYTTTFGIYTNYGESYCPAWLIRICRYGRANKPAGKKQHVISYEVPKSWFAHFYAYAVLLQFVFCYNLVSIYTSSAPAQAAADSWLRPVLYFVGGFNRSLKVDSTTTILTSTLFFLHVLRRLYETCFVSVFSGTKMSVMHYLIGFTHYSGSSLALIAHSVGFAGNGLVPAVDPIMWTLSVNNLNVFHYSGLLLFLYGYFQQNKVHKQFAALRMGKDNQVATLKHGIPQGGLFEKVSSPNYWAEIIIYASICVLFAFRNSAWNCVFIWVLSNQILLGIANHKWYQHKYPNYPKSRKAVIPYLW